MKKLGFYLIVGCVSLLLGACNKLDIVPVEEDDVPAVVEEPMLTKQVFLDVSMGTNFSYKWSELDQISLFVVRQSDMNIEHLENMNVPATYRYGSWNIDSQIKIDDDQWRAFAYYPYTEGLTDYRIPITPEDTTFHLVGSSTVPFGYHNNNINIELWQPTALLTVYVRKQGNVDKKVVKSVRLFKKSGGLPVEGILDILGQKIEYTKYGDYLKDDLSYIVRTSANADPIDFRVMPTVQKTKAGAIDNSAPTYIEIGINEGVYTAELPLAVSDWEGGKQYTVNIIYNNDVLLIESVSIRLWQTQQMDIFPRE